MRGFVKYNMLLGVALFLTLGIFFVFFWQLWFLAAIFFALVAYLVTGYHRYVAIVVKTLPRDIRGLGVILLVKWKCNQYRYKNYGIANIFLETCRRNPIKTAFHFEDKRWTFNDVNTYSNRVANYFYENDYRKGNIIAVFLENRPEMICFWLGLSKIGVTAALINYNLRNSSLAHCINVSKATAILYSGEMSEAIRDVIPLLNRDVRLYSFKDMLSSELPSTNLEEALESASTHKPPYVRTHFQDKLFYIFTSGTTGLPKAAVITHTRFYYMAYAIGCYYDIKQHDNLYITLPLYHTVGGVIGIGQVLVHGASVTLRRKFSASRFWNDCVKYNCTAAMYIGEICRYLLAQPHNEAENDHKIRLMFGNSLKPQIWKDFQQRFCIKQIGEFYGATEGNCALINNMNKVGAVGFATRIAPSVYPVNLVKVDPDTGVYMRDEDGLCIKAEPGEVGELVGAIQRGDPLREYDGYVNTEESNKKVIRDVFRKGDMAFLTGDMFVMDEEGYMYFRDRTGDTYRWKGENVSTNEVEAVVSNFIKLNDAVAYGVEVPGNEGCAGMVAIVDENLSVDIEELNKALQRALPSYARPRFLRICQSVSTTGTFKLKKTELRKEGYNLSVVKDKLYYYDIKSQRYFQLTPQVYENICDGKVNF